MLFKFRLTNFIGKPFNLFKLLTSDTAKNTDLKYLKMFYVVILFD